MPPAWDKSGWIMSTTPLSNTWRKSQREYRRSPSAIGVEDAQHVGDAVHVFGEDGFLYEHEVELFQFGEQHASHGTVYAPVEVDADADIGPHRLTDLGHVVHHTLDFVPRIDVLHFLRPVHLYGAETSLDGVSRLSGSLSRPVTADPRVNLNGISKLPAK